jgi:hypothetical protein
MRENFIGTLEYLTWDRPWRMTGIAGETFDLRECFWRFAVANRDAPAAHEFTRDNYALKIDKGSDCALQFITVGAGILLSKTEGFGFSNVSAYLEMTLQTLNGRCVIVHSSAGGFVIEVDPTEEVFGVKYFGNGNSARVPDGAEIEVCKIGSDQACIFLSASGRGFECQKFDSPTARNLLHRKSENAIRAQRIGNCAITGREDQTEGTAV